VQGFLVPPVVKITEGDFADHIFSKYFTMINEVARKMKVEVVTSGEVYDKVTENYELNRVDLAKVVDSQGNPREMTRKEVNSILRSAESELALVHRRIGPRQGVAEVETGNFDAAKQWQGSGERYTVTLGTADELQDIDLETGDLIYLDIVREGDLRVVVVDGEVLTSHVFVANSEYSKMTGEVDVDNLLLNKNDKALIKRREAYQKLEESDARIAADRARARKDTSSAEMESAMAQFLKSMIQSGSSTTEIADSLRSVTAITTRRKL